MAVIGGTANAQIIYTDVHPDTTLWERNNK